MKKIITPIVSLFLVSAVSFGQTPEQQFTRKIVESTPTKKQQSTNKAAGDTLWYTNFDNSTNWLSTAEGTGGTVGGDYGWQISADTATAKTWAFKQGMNSTSKGAFAFCENGNPNPPANHKPNAEWTLTLDTIFNFGALQNIILEFEQYGAWFTDYQAVEASNDGGVNWVEIGSNSDLPNLSTLGGKVYNNPHLRKFNATAAFPGEQLNNFKIRFRVSWPGASNKGIMYGWLIDDLRFIEGPDYDIEIQKLFLTDLQTEFEHTIMPKNIAGEYSLNLQALVKNNSVLDPTETKMEYIIKKEDGTVVTSAIGGVLSNNFDSELDSINFQTNFNYSTLEVGTYTVDAIIKLPNQTDAYSFNDTLRRTFKITSNVLGQTNFDESVYYGNFSKTSDSTSKDLQMGSVFYAPTDLDIYGYEFYMVNTPSYPTTAKGELYIKAFEYDPNAGTNAAIFSDLGIERIFTLTDEMVPDSTGKLVVFDFNKVTAGDPGMFTLVGGGYYMVAFAFSGGDSTFIAYGQSLTDEDNSTWIYGAFGGPTDPPANYRLEKQLISGVYTAPIINVGVAENPTTIKTVVAPNPFNKMTQIIVDLKQEMSVGIVVTDMSGRVVQTIKPVIMTTGQHDVTVNGEGLNAGVYNCIITLGNEVVTKRIVKK